MNLGDKMTKLIIFDVDGTILNTIDTIRYHVNKAFEGLGLEGFTNKEVEEVLGYSSNYLIESLLKKRGVDYDEKLLKKTVDDYHRSYQKEVSRFTKAYEGIVDILIELRENKYDLVALSNKPQHTLSRLFKEIDFEKYFDYYMGQEDDFPKKPDPHMVNKILDRFSVDKKDVILVGDSEVDYMTAENSGVDFIAVTWGFRSKEYLLGLKPKYIVDTREDLLKLLKGGDLNKK